MYIYIYIYLYIYRERERLFRLKTPRAFSTESIACTQIVVYDSLWYRFSCQRCHSTYHKFDKCALGVRQSKSCGALDAGMRARCAIHGGATIMLLRCLCVSLSVCLCVCASVSVSGVCVCVCVCVCVWFDLLRGARPKERDPYITILGSSGMWCLRMWCLIIIVM